MEYKGLWVMGDMKFDCSGLWIVCNLKSASEGFRIRPGSSFFSLCYFTTNSTCQIPVIASAGRWGTIPVEVLTLQIHLKVTNHGLSRCPWLILSIESDGTLEMRTVFQRFHFAEDGLRSRPQNLADLTHLRRQIVFSGPWCVRVLAQCDLVRPF